MYDILPFPSINAKEPEEQVAQLTSYLIQLKEELEFVLTNISVDNLSADLVERLNSLGADVEKSEESEEQLAQIVSNSVSASDVVNSDAFASALDDKMEDVQFNVNFDTGNLEYTTSKGDG
jgi:uncharacterized protein (DUF342 family)